MASDAAIGGQCTPSTDGALGTSAPAAPSLASSAIIAIVVSTTALEPEATHRVCWYSRRTSQLPLDISVHTIEDGQLLFCVHPMLFPIVGYEFDIRNCDGCDYFKRRLGARGGPGV